jgi:hypothetical protein
MFSLIWKLALWDKYTHKHIHDDTHTHVYTEREHDCISGTVWGHYGGAGERKRMLESEK